MKIIYNNTKQKKYPYLGISNINIIVLFTGQNEGVVISQEKKYKLGGNSEIGDYKNDIAEVAFIPYEGTITISNN